MMSRPFTFREKVLLIIMSVLIIAVIYIKFVYLDISDTIAQGPQLVNQAQDELTFEQTKNDNIRKMLSEIESAKSSGKHISEMPDYDNLQKLMIELNGILIEADKYTVSFMPLIQQDNVVRREMKLSYTAGDYKTAEDIIEKIGSSKYRNLVISISMTAGNESINTGKVTVNADVLYFELGKAVSDNTKNKTQTSEAGKSN